MAKKLLKKMIKKEKAKYSHSGFYEVPHNYGQIPGNNSNDKSKKLKSVPQSNRKEQKYQF
jgi:hypothetical protein